MSSADLYPDASEPSLRGDRVLKTERDRRLDSSEVTEQDFGPSQRADGPSKAEAGLQLDSSEVTEQDLPAAIRDFLTLHEDASDNGEQESPLENTVMLHAMKKLRRVLNNLDRFLSPIGGSEKLAAMLGYEGVPQMKVDITTTVVRSVSEDVRVQIKENHEQISLRDIILRARQTVIDLMVQKLEAMDLPMPRKPR